MKNSILYINAKIISVQLDVISKIVGNLVIPITFIVSNKSLVTAAGKYLLFNLIPNRHKILT